MHNNAPAIAFWTVLAIMVYAGGTLANVNILETIYHLMRMVLAYWGIA